jgi:acyltransferase
MGSQRIHWIDIAKGIGIIFIIYAHALGPKDYRHLFYSFHIPLFFFLSGIVYNPQKYRNILTFIKKSAKGLLLPYLIYAFIFFIIWLIKLKTNNLFSPEIIRQFFSIFYANSNNGLMIFNNILWFLPVLFVTRILFVLIYKFFTKNKILTSILISFSLLGYLISIFGVNIKLPLGIETAISAVVFYGLGFLWNTSQKAKEIVFKYKYLLFLPLLMLGAYLSNIEFQIYGHQIDMRLNHLNNYFSFYIAAFCGIFAWISFSQILNKNKILEIIGRNTLSLFVWHYFIFTYLDLYLKPILNQNIKLFIPLIYTIISIVIILFANFIYEKMKLIFRGFVFPSK